MQCYASVRNVWFGNAARKEISNEGDDSNCDEETGAVLCPVDSVRRAVTVQALG